MSLFGSSTSTPNQGGFGFGQQNQTAGGFGFGNQQQQQQQQSQQQPQQQPFGQVQQDPAPSFMSMGAPSPQPDSFSQKQGFNSPSDLKRSTSMLAYSRRRRDLSSILGNQANAGHDYGNNNEPNVPSHLRNEIVSGDNTQSPGGIIPNMSVISGYDGKVGSSFNGVMSDRRSQAAATVNHLDLPRLKKKPSYVSEHDVSGFPSLSNSRRAQLGSGNTKLRGEDLPPSTSMMDLRRVEELSTSSTIGRRRSLYGGTGGLNSDLEQSPQIPHVVGSSNHHYQENTQSQEPIVLDPCQHSVIVYGYPKELARSICRHFAKYGQIAEHLEGVPEANKVLPGKYQQPEMLVGPNWIKLTYEDARSVQRAIQDDGHLFARYYTIGVLRVNASLLEEYTVAAKEYARENGGSSKENQSLYLDSISQIEPDSFNTTSMSSKGVDRRKSILGNLTSDRTNGGGGGIPRTISMPQMNHDSGDKTLRMSQSRIYPQKKRKYMPTLAGIAQGDETSSHRADDSNADKSWLKWTSKRARELVFGFDDI